MALNIKDPRAEKLAAELATSLGTTKTEAIIRALEAELERHRAARAAQLLRSRLETIVARVSKRKARDARTADEIIGHDARGLPR